MSHDDKLKLASAMAQTSTSEAPAPQIQANGALVEDLAVRAEKDRLKAILDVSLDATMRERARIRAIVFRLLGNEWTANQLIEEIDRG